MNLKYIFILVIFVLSPFWLVHAQLTPPGQEHVLRFAYSSGVVAPDDPVFDLGDEFTIAGWFFIENYDDYVFILGRQNSVRHDPPAYELSTDFGSETNQQLRFQVGTQSISWQYPLNEWFHLGITLQADTARMFVNGAEVGKVDFSGTPTTQATPFVIGIPVDENGEPTRGAGFTGMLRQISLWNRAFTSTEISETATKHLQGDEQDLLAYWKMEEYPQKEVIDSGPNQLHIPYNVELEGNQDNRFDPLWHLEEASTNPYFKVHEIPVYEIFDIPDNLVFNHLLVDFNHDGLKDIVIITSDAENQPPYTYLPVYFLKNNGDFTFEDVSDQYDGDATGIFEFAVHDFDGDGKEDFVISDHGYDFEPFPGAPGHLFLSSENYARASSARYPSPDSGFTHGLATGDINNDGFIDVFEPNGGGNGNPFVVLLNDGKGYFEDHAESYLPEIFYEGNRGGISAHIADINRDGHEDLIWGTSPTSPEYEDLNQANALLLNNQQGKLIEQDEAFEKRLFDSEVGYTRLMETGDFNGDGLLDKFSSDFLHFYEYGSLRMHINNGDTSFTYDPDLVSTVSFESQKSPVIVAATETTDFNSDGWLDVYAHGDASGSYLLLNDGTGKLVETNTILTPKAMDGGRSMDIGDMNGDGRPDITQFLPAHAVRTILILENVRDYDTGAIPVPLPQTPELTGPADGAGANSTVTLQWAEQSPHPYSDVQLATDAAFTDIIAEREHYTGLSLTVDGLQSGQTYYWRVRGENYTGTGGWSDTNTFTVVPNEFSTQAEVTFGEASSPQDYRLVALPGAVEESLANLLEGEAGTGWQAFWDDGSEEDYLVKFDGSDTFTLQPGNGFWVTGKQSFSYEETVSTIEFNSQGSASIPLHSGWNIISNPLDIDVAWSEVASTNDGSLQPAWSFDGSFSEAPDFASAKNGQAFYFLNDGGLDEMVIPYVESSEKAKSKSQQQKLQLITRLEGQQTSSSSIVFTDKDKADVVAPPSGFEGASLRFTAESDDRKYKRANSFARIYRQMKPQGQRFKISLTANPAQPVTITTKGWDRTISEKLALLDPKTGKKYDLSSDITYTPKEQNNDLMLVMGSSSFVQEQQEEFLPKKIKVNPNYPNPFNPSTTLQFALPEQADVRVRVYDIIGRQVATLINNEVRQAGIHTITFDASRQASGLYFAVFEIGQQRFTQKMMLIK